MNNNRIVCESVDLSRGSKALFKNVSLSVADNQQIFLTGKAASGKTSFGMMLAGQLYASGNIKITYNENSEFLQTVVFIPQHYNFKNKFGLSEFYYQQRYNSYDAEATITLIEAINQESVDQPLVSLLVKILHLEHRLNTPLIQLSSGERKKLQLILAFLKPAQIMILDNPYIGLDSESVNALNQHMAELSTLGVTFILIGDLLAMPAFITHILSIDNCKLILVGRSHYVISNEDMKDSFLLTGYTLTAPLYAGSNEMIRFNDVSVRYGEKIVLDKVNWLVHKGDKWLLSGHNGAGKSTLLSLISGDNPQAYANELYLFGRRRGSGETIWDIKRNIGFISPELHWNFPVHFSCLNTVLSGFFDTPGLYSQASAEQVSIAWDWLEKLGLLAEADEKFGAVSTGVQRILLLIRALVKNPPLFIFDEPCQGLDEHYTRLFTSLVDRLFADSEHTIIYITHRLDQMPFCINQILKLSAGRVVAGG